MFIWGRKLPISKTIVFGRNRHALRNYERATSHICICDPKYIYMDAYIQNLTQRCPMWLPNPNKIFVYLQQHVGWSYAHFGGYWRCILPLFFAKTTKNHPKSPQKGYLIEIYVLVFMSMNDRLPLKISLKQLNHRFPHHQIVLG